jgi:hypothetical protein
MMVPVHKILQVVFEVLFVHSPRWSTAGSEEADSTRVNYGRSITKLTLCCDSNAGLIGDRIGFREFRVVLTCSSLQPAGESAPLARR